MLPAASASAVLCTADGRFACLTFFSLAWTATVMSRPRAIPATIRTARDIGEPPCLRVGRRVPPLGVKAAYPIAEARAAETVERSIGKTMQIDRSRRRLGPAPPPASGDFEARRYDFLDV